MYGFEGLGFIFLFLFLVLSGSLAGGVDRRPTRQRRYMEREWEEMYALTELSAEEIRGSGPLQARIFRLAKRRGGKLTLSDVVIETGLSLSDAEALMNALVDNVYVRLEVTDQGRIVYEFPELMQETEDQSE